VRLRYLIFAAITIAAGLTVHLHGLWLPAAARDMAGDALWAAMMFWAISIVIGPRHIALRVAIAVAICAVVETSQLYRAPALDAVRRTLLGHLILGNDFDPRDFVSYTAGVVAAAALERAGHRSR
jgi:hypothetical protein